MTPEIEGYLDQLLSITQDLPGVVADLTDEQFNWQRSPGSWSIAQCLDHLNLTAARFLPAMDAAIAEARRKEMLSPGPFSYPLLERWFVRSQEPPPKIRARALKRFVPRASLSIGEVVPQFIDWQERIGDRLRRADGVDLQRAKHRSPVMALFTWRLGTIFALTLAHERRHLWQARQVRIDPRFPR
ncbi:MAG: hypothetical protein GEU82_03665 [Luteitalea sp.]|nr:hypothetical protein [Luteitalea sp.]